MKLPKIFSPIKIGNLEIKNRIAMAPMGTLGMVNQNGSLKSRVIDYYVERAKGGVGLIITGITLVEKKIVRMPRANVPLIFEGDLHSYAELAERVHYFGSKIFVQLSGGWGRVSRPQYLDVDGIPVSASPIPNVWDPNVTCRALDTEEVESIVKAFGDAAELVALSGCDGIELHGHEGYLIDQFMTEIWNRRDDKYGGPKLKDRLRFPTEIIYEIKRRLGRDFPICFRVGLKHMIKGLNRGALPEERFEEAGRDFKEGLELIKLLEDSGVDAFHVDKGCYDSWYWPHPPVYMKYGNMIDVAAEAKRVVKVPVIGVGRLDEAELAIRAVEEGIADIVAIGRGLLADPLWASKVREKQYHDITPCLGCQYGCMERLREKKPLSCSMNPACGREKTYGIKPAGLKKKILIIGGGIAGMEAARVATLRGHKVKLYEMTDKLGGHLSLIEILAFKYGVEKLLKYYMYQMKKLSVKIEYNKKVNEKVIRLENPDIILVATGSTSKLPEDVEFKENDGVMTSVDVLKDRYKVGKKVIIVGGGAIGCELALWLRYKGKDVTILEMLPAVLARKVQGANRQMLIDMLAINKVEIKLNAKTKEVTKKGVIYQNEKGEDQLIEGDTIVFATGLKPIDTLCKSLAKKYPHVYGLGDCVGGESIHDAIWSAYGVVREL